MTIMKPSSDYRCWTSETNAGEFEVLGDAGLRGTGDARAASAENLSHGGATTRYRHDLACRGLIDFAAFSAVGSSPHGPLRMPVAE